MATVPRSRIPTFRDGDAHVAIASNAGEERDRVLNLWADPRATLQVGRPVILLEPEGS